MNNTLDLYTDYVLTAVKQVTATGLSELVDGAVSHDSITRFLSSRDHTSKDLWKNVKPLVRQHENEDACLIFDDCIIDKPYTDENEVVNWHFDHKVNRAVKGIGVLTAFYHTETNPDSEQSEPLRIPVGYEVLKKEIHYCDVKTRKEKRESVVTKNELMRQMIEQCIANQLIFKYILADSWFSSSENMLFVHAKEKLFIFDLKSNRNAALTDEDRNKGQWKRIDELDTPDNTPVKVWLKDLEIPVLLIKQVFKNKDNSTGVRYLVSNDLSLTADQFRDLYKKRWSVEEYHKSAKQNAAIAKSPTRTIRTQCNHVFMSIFAYVKLERLKFAHKLNHFAIKAKLNMAAMKVIFKELNFYKQALEDLKSA